MPPDNSAGDGTAPVGMAALVARWRRLVIVVTSLVLALAVLQIDRLVKIELVNRFMV
jgi:hypothetical protein